VSTSQPEQSYAESRAIGDTVVTVINEASGRYRPELVDGSGQEINPDGAEDVEIPIAFNVVHIRTPAGRLLVDAGFDDPDSRWGRAFAEEWSGLTRTPGLAPALAVLGENSLEPGLIALTHVHFDHMAGLTVDRAGGFAPRFPSTLVYVGRGDWENPQEEDDAAADIHERLAVIEASGHLRLVDGERELLPGVSMIVTGGESPGHTVIRLRSKSETFFAVGDLFHFDFEVEHPDWMPPWADRTRMIQSRRRILEEAAESSATVVFSHHPFPPWGRIVKSHGGYAWRKS